MVTWIDRSTKDIALLDTRLKKELVTIVGPERFLDQIEVLTCSACDSFLQEAMPHAVVFPLTTAEVAAKAKVVVTARLSDNHRLPFPANPLSQPPADRW